MKYFYYPGCSLEGAALEYDASTRAVLRELDAELIELEDWTCCGASAGHLAGHLLSAVLPARNLALAERMGLKADLMAPCSACYLNLRKVEAQVKSEEGLLDKINTVLAEDALSYSGGVRVRHLLDVLAHDFDAERIAAGVRFPLTGLRIAPYYGCQALRPFQDFDDPERPRSMEPLIEALGAEVHPWSMGAKCCGAGLITTRKAIALELTSAILEAARGADCIATVCPMCQMNLEAYQGQLSRRYGVEKTTVLYLPQLMGLALGLGEDELRLELNLAVGADFEERVHSARAKARSA